MKGDRFQEAIHFSNIYRNIFFILSKSTTKAEIQL